jgi:hypothetical protein
MKTTQIFLIILVLSAVTVHADQLGTVAGGGTEVPAMGSLAENIYLETYASIVDRRLGSGLAS